MGESFETMSFPLPTIDHPICNGLSAAAGSVSDMAWRYDQSPGSDVTLLALYDAVLAAEELDLTEQARDDAFWAELRVMYGFSFDDDVPATDDGVVDESAEEPERPRMTQVVGLVEHLLGARFVTDS
jgi:hypothetical protein